MKSLKEYLALNYRVTLYRDEEGDYIAEIGDLQGCVAHGSTSAEALESLERAKEVWMESRLTAGLEIPEPRATDNYSGKMLLRMPRYLHQRLSQQAAVERVSLNQYVVSLLSETAGRIQPGPREAEDALLRGFLALESYASGHTHARGTRRAAPPAEPDELGASETLRSIFAETSEEKRLSLMRLWSSAVDDLRQRFVSDIKGRLFAQSCRLADEVLEYEPMTLRVPAILAKDVVDQKRRLIERLALEGKKSKPDELFWAEVKFPSKVVSSEEDEHVNPRTLPGV